MKTALVCIAKDEDEYLIEWIDYHLKLGFTDIFVYQNNWRFNGHCKDYTNVHFIELDGHRMQNKCYNDFIVDNYMKYDFIACFDVDEFLYINDGTLEDFLSSHKDHDAIYVNWRLFGDNNLKKVWCDCYTVLIRFIQCDDKLHRLGKFIINTKRCRDSIAYVNPHIVAFKMPMFSNAMPGLPQYVDSNGDVAITPWENTNIKEQRAELYHYRNKTWEENVKRKYKTDDAFHEASTCDFRNDMVAIKREFDAHNKNVIVNTKARDFLYE